VEPRKEEVVGGWRIPDNEELRNFYSPPNTIRVIKLRMMKLAGQVAQILEVRNAHKISAVNSERKRLHGRPKRQCERNIGMELTEKIWLRLEAGGELL
jgi:hypothetical protein